MKPKWMVLAVILILVAAGVWTARHKGVSPSKPKSRFKPWYPEKG